MSRIHTLLCVSALSFLCHFHLQGQCQTFIRSTAVASPICTPTATNGSIAVTVQAGTPPFRFQWSTGDTTANLSNLRRGTYRLLIRDARGCIDTVWREIDTIPGLTKTQITLCPAGPAREPLFVDRSGHPYQLDWSHLPGTNDPPYLENITAGTYTLTIRSTNGCTATRRVQALAGALAVFTGLNSRIVCGGVNNGGIKSSATGGTAYTYLWSNGATTTDIANLAAGTYTVTVRDVSGCTGTSSLTLTAPPTLTATTQPTTCNGYPNTGALVTVQGGTPPYRYNWNNAGTSAQLCPASSGMYTVTVTDSQNCTRTASQSVQLLDRLSLQISTRGTCVGRQEGQITATATGGLAPYRYTVQPGGNLFNLAAGTYTVTVTDVAGVTATATATVPQFASVLPFISNDNVVCQATNDLSVLMNAGTPPYTYLWNIGVSTSRVTVSAPGVYTVTVRDANNCTGTATTTVVRSQPVSVIIAVTQAACDAPGTLRTVVSDPVGNATYAWSGGLSGAAPQNVAPGRYVVTVTNTFGCTATAVGIVESTPLIRLVKGNACAATTDVTVAVQPNNQPYRYDWAHITGNDNPPNLTQIGPGTYTVTVSSLGSKGCSATGTVRHARADTAFTLESFVTQNRCFGSKDGSISLTVRGGGAPYTYAWSTNQTTATLSAIGAGTYTVTVTDANGCSATVSKTLLDPLPMSVTTSKREILCIGSRDGSATASVAGGTGPFLYFWSNGNTGSTVNGIGPGTYTVTVSDSRGCSATTSVQLIPVSSLTVVRDSTLWRGCVPDTGSIGAIALRGTGPYQFTWSTGFTTSLHPRSVLRGVRAGTYGVTVRDALGCISTARFVLSSSANLSVVPNYCDGETTLTGTNGVSPYTFRWEDGITSATRSIAPGNYKVTVTDAAGCSKVQDVGIAANPPGCTRLEGTVRRDANNNCLPEPIDTPLSGWVVQATNGAGEVFLARTGEDGSYSLRLVPGNYRVRLLVPTEVNITVCKQDVEVTLTAAGQIVMVNFVTQRLNDCPALQTSVFNNLLRRCFEGNEIDVRVCNQGTVTAMNAYVDVTLDRFLLFERSNIPATSLGNNRYRFRVGNLTSGQCTTFFLFTKVSCDAALGQNHCIEAYAYPDTS